MPFRSPKTQIAQSVVAKSLGLIALISPAAAWAQQEQAAGGDGEIDPSQSSTDQAPGEAQGGVLQLPERPGLDQVEEPDGRRDRQARGTAVRERIHPELTPYGVELSTFKLNASAEAGAGYDSNVFGRSGGPGDVYALIGGDLQLKSQWQKHSLELNGRFSDRIHARYSSEDGTSYRIAALGNLDVTHDDSISAELSHERVVTPRGDVTELDEGARPTRYLRNRAAISGNAQLGRISSRLSAEVSDYKYAEDPSLAGTPADPRFRDYKRWSVGAELGYEIAPGKSVFVEGRKSYLRYDIDATPIRDANVTEILAGLRSDITPVLRGRIGAGYIVADFADPSLQDDKGLAIDANLDWLVTELTTVRLSADRKLENAALANSPSRLKTSVQIAIDHELLRNLILSADAGYETIDYSLSERQAEQYRLGLSGTWTPNRNMQIVGNVGGQRRNSQGFDTPRSYTAFDVSVAVRFRL